MALTTAVAVLIITCPCALGLAVPAVQVVASGFLLGRGIMLKDGGALERLAAVDTVVFDKTGTLTEGEPRLVDGAGRDARTTGRSPPALGEREPPPPRPRAGRAPPATAARVPPVARRRRRASRRGHGRARSAAASSASAGATWSAAQCRDDTSARLARSGSGSATTAPRPLRLRRRAPLRRRARRRRAHSRRPRRDPAVRRPAERRGRASPRAPASPPGRPGSARRTRPHFLADLAASGHRVLMVGDGLNDAPALASAFVSMSPASAADISQTAADIVFTGRQLAPVAAALRSRTCRAPPHPPELRARRSATT